MVDQSKLVEEVLRRLMAEMAGGGPNLVRAQSGVRVVSPSEVTLEPFDTGKGGDQVMLKDVFTLEESPRIGAGFMTLDQTTFDWTLTYDEIDYVIEGTLDIHIDGKTVRAEAGDVLLIPKNSKIQFSTPDRCRFLYVVYPANWADQ